MCGLAVKGKRKPQRIDIEIGNNKLNSNGKILPSGVSMPFYLSAVRLHSFFYFYLFVDCFKV